MTINFQSVWMFREKRLNIWLWKVFLPSNRLLQTVSIPFVIYFLEAFKLLSFYFYPSAVLKNWLRTSCAGHFSNLPFFQLLSQFNWPTRLKLMTWACHSASVTDTGLTQTPHRSAGGTNVKLITYKLSTTI